MPDLVKREDAPPVNWEDVRKYYAESFNEKEWNIALGKCKALNLNPQKGEVHFVKYGENPGQVIVEYKEFLKRAERTGQLDGWGIEFDKDDNPTKATITIHRKDRKHPIIWPVYRKEFDKKRSTWNVMPNFMLMKVAIAQGMRLAFPEDLGNMPYIQEEVEHTLQTDNKNAQGLATSPQLPPPNEELAQILEEEVGQVEVYPDEWVDFVENGLCKTIDDDNLNAFVQHLLTTYPNSYPNLLTLIKAITVSPTSEKKFKDEFNKFLASI